VHRLEDVFAHVRDGTLRPRARGLRPPLRGRHRAARRDRARGREGTEARDLGPSGSELER
jgi:hypothetical protein